MANTQDIEKLAAEIGDKIYMDIAKWHLYLSDAHLHTQVAEQVYPLLEDNRVDESEVINILEEIPVSLGGGRTQVPLIELIPTTVQADLVSLLEDYQRSL
jgi:hypothetical protein